jgi:hypothetical protein
VNLLSYIRIPSGHGPCLCESGERYRTCCRDAVSAWGDQRLVEHEFLVNGHVVSSHEGTRRLGEPGVTVRARLYPPLERYLARWVGPYDLPVGEDVNMRYRDWLDDHLAEEAPGEEVWQEWWAAFEQAAAREDIWVTEIGAPFVDQDDDQAEASRIDLWTTGVGATLSDPGLMLLNAFAHPVRRKVLLVLAQEPANAARIAREAKITTPHAAYHVAELHKAGVIEPVPADRKPVRYRIPGQLMRDGIFRMLLCIARPDHIPRGFFVELGPYVDELYNEQLNSLAGRMGDRTAPPALPEAG